MSNPEFLNEPISLNCLIDAQGYITPKSLSWAGREHTIVSVGRQWEESEGRHVLVELEDGSRLEAQLNREKLIWYIKKLWRAQMMA